MWCVKSEGDRNVAPVQLQQHRLTSYSGEQTWFCQVLARNEAQINRVTLYCSIVPVHHILTAIFTTTEGGDTVPRVQPNTLQYPTPLPLPNKSFPRSTPLPLSPTPEEPLLEEKKTKKCSGVNPVYLRSCHSYPPAPRRHLHYAMPRVAPAEAPRHMRAHSGTRITNAKEGDGSTPEITPEPLCSPPA